MALSAGIWRATSRLRESYIKCRIKGIEVLGIQMILGDAQRFAEVINLSKSLGTQCLQGFRGFFSGLKNVRTAPIFCPE